MLYLGRRWSRCRRWARGNGAIRYEQNPIELEPRLTSDELECVGAGRQSESQGFVMTPSR